MTTYRDLPAEVTRNSVTWLLYAIAVIVVVYIGSVFPTAVLFYVAITLPQALMAYLVLARDPDLQSRFPILWVITGCGSTGLFLGDTSPKWAGYLLSIFLFSLFCFWIALSFGAFSV